MAVYTDLDFSTLAAAATQFGAGALRSFRGEPAGSINSNFRLSCDDGEWFLRLYEATPAEAVEREMSLVAHLADAGLATARPARARSTGRPWSLVGGKPAALFPIVPGACIAAAEATPAQLAEVGAVLARLHAAGRSYGDGGPNRYAFARISEWIDTLVQARGPTVVGAEPQLAADVAELAVARERLREEDAADRAGAAGSAGVGGSRPLPSGVIHADLFDDNVLFDDAGRLSAVLDFEMACEGAWVYDLAIATLAWCWRRGPGLEPVRAAALGRGYAAVRPLEPAEAHAFGRELRRAALRFTVSRIRDFHLRPAAPGTRVEKDYREFLQRLRQCTAAGDAECARWLAP